MASRRSLTNTTAAAGAVLIALCFVPSASATAAHPQHAPAVAPATGPAGAAPAVAPAAASTPNLADTGAVDTTPYLVGGAGFLGVGAALVLIARRRALILG